MNLDKLQQYSRIILKTIGLWTQNMILCVGVNLQRFPLILLKRPYKNEASEAVEGVREGGLLGIYS